VPTSVKTVGDYAFVNCRYLRNVYYAGTPEDELNMVVGAGNDYFTHTTWHYKTEPAEHTHEYQNVWSGDGTRHWHECLICGDKNDLSNHIYDNDHDATCNICGVKRDVPGIIDQNAPQIVVESKTAPVGENFIVTVNIKNNPGFSYLELTPVFSNELELVKVENGNLTNDFSEGKQYVWTSDSNITEDGLLMTFTFKTAKNAALGHYDVAFVIRNCINSAEQPVELQISGGDIELVEYVYGDSNGDGVVNGFDVVRLKNYILNYNYDTETSTVETFTCADANGDGIIDGLDVIRLKKYIANYNYDTETSTVVLGPQ
ncbi:MAG: hypothetical protein KBS41_01740, partial [Oscillospiraceae bacterium]|nr:hypothetical protein [Candidatus Equicaccousia limihippi]